MVLTGKAKTDYQREYMRRRRSNQPVNIKQGYIYVVHCAGSTYYKIGVTYSGLEQRLKALQTGCPHTLTMSMAFAVTNPEAEENMLHRLFKEYRVRGEWFDLDEQGFCDVILTLNPMMVGYVPPKE